MSQIPFIKMHGLGNDFVIVDGRKENPNLVQKSTEEFIQRRGADLKYQALVGDRDPPLDYRK